MNEIEPYLDFVRPLYEGRDPGHDFRHIERIASRLDGLSEGLAPPPLAHKLNFLACFHGLGGRIHAEPELMGKTKAFLRGLGWKQDDIDMSLSSLLTHLKEPRTPEEMVVHDANCFELPGAFGIAKAFTVGGARGQTFEQTADIFQRNLDRVVFRTPAGKLLAAGRIAYAREFLQELKKEL